MRYFSTPDRERHEAPYVSSRFGKSYQPSGAVTLGDDSVIDSAGVTVFPLRDAALAIHADAGAWAFLSPAEASFLGRLAPTRFAAVKDSVPQAGRFVAHLFRRGLVGINGLRAIDARMFEDSPNYEEGHLVEMLVTEKCNLGCHYCLAGAEASMPAMTPEIARRTVDLAFAMDEAKVLGFEFSGGEPFLKYALMRELVSYIRQHPERRNRAVYLSIQSNGTLLDAERVRWLVENEISIGLSLDGHPASHNESRPLLGGGESFSRLIEGIDLLQRAGVKFGALVVLNRSNVSSVVALVDFLLDNDITSFKLNPVSFLGTAQKNWERTGLGQDEVTGYFVELLDLIVSRGYPLVEANLHTMLRFLTSKQRATRCLRGHCGAGDTFQAISAAGDIYPCGRATQSPGLKVGNVLSPTCGSLSAPGRDHGVLVELRARRPTNLEGCDTCPYRQFCQAGCAAQAYERYGTVRHRTPECDFYKALYPHLMYELTFRAQALETLNRIGYLEGKAELVSHEYAR